MSASSSQHRCNACRLPDEISGVDAQPSGSRLWKVKQRRAVRWTAATRTATSSSQWRIRTLVLDMGGVVIPTLFESVAIDGFPDGPLGDDPAYREVERGELAERAYWVAVNAARPDVDIRELWQSCSYVRHELRHALEAIASRVRLVAFTNDMVHWFGGDWPDRFRELSIFDAIIEAAKLGVEKPDPEAFRRALSELGERPERCLFVDDLAANLAGAEEVGMRTLHFDVRDPAGSVRELLEALGLDDEPTSPRRAFVVPQPTHETQADETTPVAAMSWRPVARPRR